MELVGGVVHLGDDVGHSARLSEYLDLSRLLREVENVVYRPPQLPTYITETCW